MRDMQQTAPGLLPLFRSGTQLAILGLLYTGADRAWPLSAMADHLRLGLSTVSREVSRLEEAGIVRVEELGRNKLVSANWDLPWAQPLAALLDRTVGPLPLLAEALSGAEGIRQAWIYGSWATRYHGEIGPAPRDIDVLVVGNDIDLVDLVTRTDQIADRVGVPVNTHTVTPAEWARPARNSFTAQIKAAPLVPIPIDDNVAADA